MDKSTFLSKVKKTINQPIPLPNTQRTAQRLCQLFAVARDDLSLAKICEAHWDALAILAEAKKQVHSDALYGVWASEIPGQQLSLHKKGKNYYLSGQKMFCSGAGLVDRVLVTAFAKHSVMIDLDLATHKNTVRILKDNWYTTAFQHTNTATVVFDDIPVDPVSIIDAPNWYVLRDGFWVGALGPAACWAGGAAGLVDYAQNNKRKDAHTLAHLGALSANVWAMQSLLTTAGNTIDEQARDHIFLHELALMVRHQVEQMSTDSLRRFARAYGPFPMACDAEPARRYQELDLFLRQNHAERDLESLGMLIYQRMFAVKPCS